MKKEIYVFIAALFLSLMLGSLTGHLVAQPVTTCENSNFNFGSFKDWQGCYGYFGAPPSGHGPCETIGFLLTPQPPLYDNPLHKIIPAPGWPDGNTCDSLPNVFPGEAFVARIGDTAYSSPQWATGKEAELRYAVTVSNDSYLFIYRYAVVLQNGNHAADMQPDFQVMITDNGGNVLDSTCGYYYICAPPTGQIWPGWHSCVNNISWKDWTTVGLDLTPYFGQTVYINFKVRGCYYDTHFGYAMISAYCGYLQLQTALCEGDSSATLTAPPGFTYLWNTGDTIQSIIVQHPLIGEQYSCTLTAVNGCWVTITVNLTYTVIHSNFTYGSACAGNPVQFTDSSWVNQNWVTDWIWDYGDGSPPDSGIAAPLHTFASSGTYDVKLISYSTEGCLDSIVKQIHVDSVPHVTNQPLIDTICSKAGTNIILTADLPGATFTWTATSSSPDITGFSDNAIPATLLDQILINTGTVPDTVFYTIFPNAGDCPGPDTIYKVIVNPLPVLTNSPLVKSICDSTSTSIILQSNNDSTSFFWTCAASSPNLTGFSANIATPDTIIDQVIDNTGFAIDTVYYYIVPWSFGCPGDTAVYKVAVYPSPDLSNIPPAKSQCNNTSTNVTLTSNVTGTTFTWTCIPSSGNITGWADNAAPTTILNQTLVNSGYNIEWVTYQVTPTANGCTGTPSNYVVTVYPSPNMSNVPASKSQCDNLATNITLTSNVAGTLFTWTCIPSSGNITGWSNNAVPTVTLNQTLDNTGFNVEWVTYQVTPAANGCNGPVTNYVVTVYPTPNLSNMPPSMQLCNNSFTNQTLTSNAAGALFTWTCTPSSANITGWSNNAVPTTLLNQFLTNSGLSTEWVIYHVTPTANGCTGPVTDYTVTVVQTPDVFFNPSAQTICSQQTSNIQVLSSVPGTTFTWTVTPSSPNLSGQAPGSGSLIAQTVTNSGNTIETVTFHVTPMAFGCPPGNSQDIVLTVNPRPAVSNVVTNFQICSAAATNITLTSTVPGSTFAWTASGSSPNVSGYTNGAGGSILQTLTNTGFNIEAVTYQVTPTANGCAGNATPFVVTVFPVANVIFTPNGQTLCSGTITSISLSSSVAGTSFTWTASGSGPSLSGYFPGSGNFIQQTLFNSGPYPQWATYQVAPTANGCPGINNSVIVMVNPLPPMSFTPCFDAVVSVNAQPIPLKGALPLGGTYSGTGVSAGTFFPAFAGPGNHVITYSFTNAWGCPGTANASINVVVLAPFTCGNTVIDVRDNQPYTTVQIGTQCWFAANLNYGTNILSTQMQRDNCSPEKYCFGDNPANCSSTGGMYQWDELMGYAANNGAQGFCPPEWHVPTEGDWNILFAFYISNGFAGSPLKYTGYSGFNAFLSGTRFNNVQWDFNNFAVMFWSSTSHAAHKAWAHGMNTFNPSVSYYPSHRNNAFWTRCIKD